MNYVIVRTRLQALIVLKLIELDELKTPFTCIRLYQYHLNEDSRSVYKLYDKIGEVANKSVSLVQVDGFWKATSTMLRICYSSYMTGGNVFLASIDFYPFALAVKLCPFVRIKTFDDGTANVQVRDTSYHSQKPLHGDGFKKRISSLLFPAGCSSYLRKKILIHYTIYPYLANIVTKRKIKAIKIDWNLLLSQSDLISLPITVKTILLGTVFHQSENGVEYEKIAIKLFGKCDIYLPHPREKKLFEGEKVIDVDAPAESVIDHFSRNNRVKVFHFGSSVSLSFSNNPHINFDDVTA